MKITKGRIHKILLKEHQTRKKNNKCKTYNSHTYTCKNKKKFNLRNCSLKK